MTPREKRPNAVKATVVLDEEVFIRAKQEAIARRTTFSDMVEGLLRRELGMFPEPQKSAATVTEELRQSMGRKGG